MMTLQRTRPMILRISAPAGEIEPKRDELIERQLVLLEFADRQRRAVDRQRRRDDVDARAVQQARVADRRGLVDAPADLADDALADVHQLGGVAKADVGQLDLAADFDEGQRVGAVDHDVGDVVARQQRLERAEAEHVVADVVEQVLLLGDRQDEVLDRRRSRGRCREFPRARFRDRAWPAPPDRSPRSARRRSSTWSGNSRRTRRSGWPEAAVSGAAAAGERRLDARRRRRDRRRAAPDAQSGIGTLTEHALFPCVYGRRRSPTASGDVWRRVRISSCRSAWR